MPQLLKYLSVSLDQRQGLIKNFPCFSTLTLSQREELAHLMQEYMYQPKEKIVNENEIVDSIYLIVAGEAEVEREIKEGQKILRIPIAILTADEAIGLNDTGFFSTTGKRTADVTAITHMLVLKLDLQDLNEFLKKNNLEIAMYAASLQMLRMGFIKQSLPFSKLSHERLQWLADHVEEISVPAGSVIFNQGEEGDKCYLIRTGQIEIVAQDPEGKEKRLALLKPVVLFGEATLITREKRNATARALTQSELLVLSREHLSELIENESDVAKMFMSLMVDRSRPIQNSHVTLHERLTADGQLITILKNNQNNSYFKLSEEGAFIWQQLDGQHTLQDITLDLADKYQVFAPDMVAALISKLNKAEFISNLEITNEIAWQSKPWWWRTYNRFRPLIEKRFAFGDANQWLEKIYQKYVRFLFTKIGKMILTAGVVVGFFVFVMQTPNILLFLSYKRIGLLLILALIPFGLLAVFLHELGHAFTVKSYGREVHYIGVGWRWLMPLAFTDTSDMWLATRKPRMIVNLAGVFVDALVAGISALLILLIENPYIQSLLWLFALYTYVSAFRNLSPLQEMDGYYVLMDWVEKNKLRQSAVIWLVKKFPKALKNPKLFKENWPEVSYWIACLIFLILVSIVTLIIQHFILTILEIGSSNSYLVLIFPVLVMIISSIGIILDIRHKAEE